MAKTAEQEAAEIALDFAMTATMRQDLQRHLEAWETDIRSGNGHPQTEPALENHPPAEHEKHGLAQKIAEHLPGKHKEK